MRTTGCAVPDASVIRDLQAEKIVLAGLLHYGRVCVAHLGGLTRGHFYHDAHGELFDLTCYVMNGDDPPLLVGVYEEYKKRGLHVDAMWLADVWHVDTWLADMMKWGDPFNSLKLPNRVWAAAAASQKVHHLAARRSAIYAASEVIRDALDPVGDADSINRRTDDIAQEEY